MSDRYCITGATGYIGSMLSKKLIARGADVTVIIRNPLGLDREIRASADIITADLTDCKALSDIVGMYDYIIHCAAPTKSAYMISHPVQVINTIVNGSEHILKLAKRCGARSMVYLSSMEVYGQIDCHQGRRVTEEELGYIDVTNIRNCYPFAKLMTENLCISYYKEYEVPVKIVRLAQTFGRGILPEDNRVFAQFANAVKMRNDIVLHTAGDSMGNYCDLDDCMEAILFVLHNGMAGQIYNVVNEDNTMTIRDMAELVAKKVAGGRIRVVCDAVESEQFGYAPKTGLRLSGAKLKKMGWEAKTDLEHMYIKMLNTKINERG